MGFSSSQQNMGGSDISHFLVLALSPPVQLCRLFLLPSHLFAKDPMEDSKAWVLQSHKMEGAWVADWLFGAELHHLPPLDCAERNKDSLC